MSLHETQSISWNLGLGVLAEAGHVAATKQMPLDTLNRGYITGSSSFLVGSPWGWTRLLWVEHKTSPQLFPVEEKEISSVLRQDEWFI